MLSSLGSLLVLLIITVVPVKLAAGFVGAERDTWLLSALAVIIDTVLAVVGYKLVGGNLPGLATAFLALVSSYPYILTGFIALIALKPD